MHTVFLPAHLSPCFPHRSPWVFATPISTLWRYLWLSLPSRPLHLLSKAHFFFLFPSSAISTVHAPPPHCPYVGMWNKWAESLHTYIRPKLYCPLKSCHGCDLLTLFLPLPHPLPPLPLLPHTHLSGQPSSRHRATGTPVDLGKPTLPTEGLTQETSSGALNLHSYDAFNWTNWLCALGTPQYSSSVSTYLMKLGYTFYQPCPYLLKIFSW